MGRKRNVRAAAPSTGQSKRKLLEHWRILIIYESRYDTEPSARETQLDDIQEYYAGRCEKAREMASAAESKLIAKIHQEMAEHYEGLANGSLSPKPTAVED